MKVSTTRRTRTQGTRIGLSCAVLLMVFCGAPRVAHAGLFSVSPSQERNLGEDAARQIDTHSRLVTGPVADWVNRVGQRLVAVSDPEFKYSFRVIDSPEINAFALPGGYVYVYTGLRKVVQTDDELAAVLAHEITHAEQHHFARQYKKASKRGFILSIFSMAVGLPNIGQQLLGMLDFAITQKYSRSMESDSDRDGMRRMARAGFNPNGMVLLLSKLSKESGKTRTLDKWFGDHPDAAKRVTAAQAAVGEIRSLQRQNSPLVKPQFSPWNGAATVSGVTTPAAIAPEAGQPAG